MTRLAVVGDDPSTGAYLSTYAIDLEGASYRSIDRVPLSARALHLRADASSLWACLVDDTVAHVPVDRDGKLSAVRSTSITGLPCHSELVGSTVVISLYHGGSLAVLRPGQQPRCLPMPGPASAAPSKIHQALLDPAGRYVLVFDIGAGAILTLDADSLELIARYSGSGAVAPRNGVFLPGDQTRLLVTGQDDATMTDFSYDPERGVLTHRGTVRTGAFPAAIAAGRAAVYQADREAGGVSVARTGTGHLAVEQFPTGTWPIDVRVLTSGSREWLVVANRDSGDLSVRFLDHEGTPGGVVFAIAAPGVSSVAAL